MTEDFRLNLSRIWLLVGGLSLILAVFLPSSAHPQNFLQNVIGTMTVTMFILSFPSSLLAIPIMFYTQIALGIDPNTIGGMYLNLFLMFVLGLVQWFWVVPRLTKKDGAIKILNLNEIADHPRLPGQKTAIDTEFFDSRSRSPIERVISDDETD